MFTNQESETKMDGGLVYRSRPPFASRRQAVTLPTAQASRHVVRRHSNYALAALHHVAVLAACTGAVGPALLAAPNAAPLAPPILGGSAVAPDTVLRPIGAQRALLERGSIAFGAQRISTPAAADGQLSEHASWPRRSCQERCQSLPPPQPPAYLLHSFPTRMYPVSQ